MQLCRHFSELPQALKGCVVAIGNFDGLHRGHQAVIGRCVAAAREMNAPCLILCFEPHPRRYFLPELPPFRLMNLAEKARECRRLGAQGLLAQRFNADFATLSAEAFVERVLIQGLQARKVLTGNDFIFGHARSGHAALLAKIATQSGAFDYEAVDPVGNAGEGKFSSSKLREHLRQGEMRHVAELLGRPYRWQRPVIRGEQRGRKIGFPTTNHVPPALLCPKYGVYAVRGSWPGQNQAAGVANWGVRPTIGGEKPLLEVHWFDVTGELYGQRLTIEWIDFLREEKAFDSFDALQTQIASDAARAREILQG